MLTIGQQLYSLTARDLTTSFLDPYFRSGNSSLGATVANGNLKLSVPVDRSLFLHSFFIDLSKEAATDWESWSIIAKRPGNETAAILYQRAVVPVLNQRVSDTYQVGIILPPGISEIQFGPTRVTATNLVTYAFGVNGFLIPPGKMIRA